MKIKRRSFIKYLAIVPPVASLGFKIRSPFSNHELPGDILSEWKNPPAEFSQAPFWFWNDELSESEIIRQINDFHDHGIQAFVIHPRVGLPGDIGFMSDNLLGFMRIAIKEAAKRNMWCMLYDEGMYPSGAASGLIVKENPSFRPHGLFAVDLDESKPGEIKSGFKIGESGVIELEKDQKLIAVVKRKINGHRIAILDRFISPGYSLIRGLHFLDPGAQRKPDHKEVPEEMPELADILNPESVKAFIRIVYQRYYDEFKDYFGNTIKGIFTDEPSIFGKNPEEGAMPGNFEALNWVSRYYNEDITGMLPGLWYNDEPGAEEFNKKYLRALNRLLEETYYKQLHNWCEDHNTALAGHPGEPDDIGHLRYFQLPGQDIVWRFVDMDKPSALEGAESTNAKCASSAMIHLGRRRNSNEYCGAYGHDFTFKEMKWLANWLLIRGCNLLYPHAFYYSIRGPRVDERPPDVGPNNLWWNEFKPFTKSVSQLCWLNTDSRHVCDIAILGQNDSLPWISPSICFRNQYDFNYIEARHLWEDARIDEGGIHIAGMNYKVLITESAPPPEAESAVQKLEKAGRLIRFSKEDSDDSLLERLSQVIEKDVIASPANADIRIRHVVKNGRHFYLIFNEGKNLINTRMKFNAGVKLFFLEQNTLGSEFSNGGELILEPHQMRVLLVKNQY